MDSLKTHVNGSQSAIRAISRLAINDDRFVGLTKIARRFRIAVAVICCLQQSLPDGMAAERAAAMVQSALRSEIDLDIDERFRMLDAAQQRDPSLPELHWARGEVRVNGQWQSLEAAAAIASEREDLKQYEAERSRADETVEGHERIAQYCHKHHLAKQERAHWTAILALAPNHTEARQRLGQVNVDGVWIDSRQLEEQKKAERETHQYLIKHGKTVVRLAKSLDNKSLTHEQVVRGLRQFHDPLVIPWLESVLSSRGEAGGLCAVETLASFPWPEASLSLARHAMDSPIETVRQAATDSLKRRDEHSFVPAMLAALKSPVSNRDEFAITNDNMLIWRRTVSFETQDTKKVATFDRIFPEESFVGLGAATANWTQRAKAAGDLEVQQVNQSIESTNQRVMAVLSQVSNPASVSGSPSIPVESKKTPEDWWNWWNDRNESYPSDTKSVQTRYETAFISPSVIETPSRPRSDCLASGTPVWTVTGPVRVEEVQIGDMVLTQNQRSGELKFAPVLTTSERAPERLLSLTVGGETIRATGGHTFWVSGQGWIKARSLEPGMGLHTARGVVMLDAIEEETKSTKTYNLIVDECHSYFVGRNLILSHDNTLREPVANRVPGLREDFGTTSRN